MIEPPLSPDEPLRLEALRRTQQLDTPLEERFERITRLAQRVLRVPIVAISLVDVDRQWFKSIQGLDAAETSRAVSFCGHTILQNDTMVVQDARVDPRFSDNPLVTGDPRIVFYAACPISGDNGTNIGSLCVIDRKPRDMSREDLEVLRDLAGVVEAEMAKMVQSEVQKDLLAELDVLRRKAHVDALTRVWNRAAIIELFHAELARAGRSGGCAGVIMADIDNFKQINDTHGHVVGDEVIRQTARKLLGAIRECDSLGRYGGEEFMIVFGGCEGFEGAIKIAEHPFATQSGDIPVTMSVGLAFADQLSVADAEALIRAADRALYRAKHDGRNRVKAVDCGPSLRQPNEPAPDPADPANSSCAAPV